MYEKLNKKAIGCMFSATLVRFIITTAILFLALLIVNTNTNDTVKKVVQITIITIIVIDLMVVIISPKIRYNRYRYLINEDKIDVIEGFIFIKRNIVPINRLHKLSVHQGPIDRIFGLAKVSVSTAGGDVVLRFLENEKANFIAEALKEKINEVVEDEVQTDEAR